MDNLNPILMQRYLGEIEFRVTKNQLVRKAQENGAGDNIVRLTPENYRR